MSTVSKKSFRNITIGEQKFYFRRAGYLSGNIVDEGLSITFTPQNNKHNYLYVNFPLSYIEIEPSDYLGVDKNCPYPGLLNPCFYNIKAVKDGQAADIDFGKTKAVSEVLAYILEHEIWDVKREKHEQILDGWEILIALGYSDFLPHLTWSW